MTIALRSSQTAGNATGTDLTVTTPAGAASGDYLTAVFYREAGTLGLPAGWTQSGSDQRDTGADNLYLTFACLKLTSAPAANYTFTVSTSTWRTCVMSCWTGNFDTDPTDVAATGGNGASTSTPVATDITTIEATTMVIAAHGNYNGSDVTAGTSSYTEASGLGGTELWYKSYTSSGATGAKSFSFSPSTPGSDWATFHFAFKEAAAVTLEQEGFRFGVDDGSESGHTWEAAQDTNISTAAGESRLLRFIVNATGDPAAIAFKLKYQKNGSGGYATVPIGATGVGTTPVIEAGDTTSSGDNATTPTSPWAVSRPTAATGDLLIMIIGWDDSVNNTGISVANGPNGEVWSQIGSVVSSASTEARMTAYYVVATGSWGAGSISVTPNANEQWTATVIKVLAGEFDASTPIGASNTRASAGTAETSALSPSLTAGASDGGGRLIWAVTTDTDPLVTLQSGNTSIANNDRGNEALGVAIRDTAVTNSESIAGGATWSLAGDSWCSITFVVRAPIVNNDYYITTSANIAAGGEDTTARLTAPSAKSTSDFVTGRRWDNENGTDTTNITTDDYSEFEYFLTVRSGLSASDYFDSRLYNGDTPLDTYTNTPRWTIASAAGQPRIIRQQGIPGMKTSGRVSGW